MITSLRRFLYVAYILLPSFVVYFLTKNNPESKGFLKTTVTIREKFQKLGTTFIKLGQMLSARPDIVGPQLSSELRNLLDHEPVIPPAEVEKILTEELKASPKEVFAEFETIPLASASIAQVHKAVLHNKRVVAVKVQRPHIEALIQKDLKALKLLASLLTVLFSSSSIRFSYIYQEFADWITNELDFQVEGRRADKFRVNMAPLEGIVIPEIYWKYTTQKVLVMEFLDGDTLNELLDEMKAQNVHSLYDLKYKHALQPDILIKRIIGAIAKQAFSDRYFHGDLHPANIIILPHEGVGFVDFGIVGTLDNQEYMELVLTMLALVENDPEALLKSVLSLMTQPLSQAQTANLQEVLSLELHKLHEDTGGKVSLNHFILTLLSVAQRYNMLWTPGVLLAVKTIGQIDFVAGQIGIREPLVDLMKPAVEKYIAKAISSTVSKEELFKAALDLFQTSKKLPDTLTKLEDMIDSGSLVKIQPPSRGTFSPSFPHKLALAGASGLISFPILASTPLIRSAWAPLLLLGVPLLFYIILSTIFTKREEVK